MADDNSIDRILSPWAYENGSPAPPPAFETRLLSTNDNGSGGSVHLTPEALNASAGRLDGLRADAERDINAALRESDHVNIGPNLQVTKEIAHVHERWGEKLRHLLSDMDDRASRLRKAANNWSETEKANTKALDDI